MASPILHIKDSYYFDVPKFSCRAQYTGHLGDNPFPDFWIRLDCEYQTWEARQLIARLHDLGLEGLHGEAEAGEAETGEAETIGHYEHWKHEDHANFGKPFDLYLSQSDDELSKHFLEKLESDTAWAGQWKAAVGEVRTAENFAKYKTGAAVWSQEKIKGYNKSLSGKILIPQPFGGTIKNLHESASGFCLSKYMIIEVVAALLVAVIFIRIAGMIRSGGRPRGKFWNFFESMLVFVRDEVARPAIGKPDADRFVPLLWSIFFFILACNLFGMLPWAGAPTSAFAVTLSMAAVTLATGVICGSIKFGPIGYWLNQVPSMELPFVMAIVLKPMIFVIEVVGLFIKHGVLGVRLLANMVAGHLVLLSIMGLAFSIEGAASDLWGPVAGISVVSATLFSCLELFVAFLQAYIFTFLSALFIGAAVHHH